MSRLALWNTAAALLLLFGSFIPAFCQEANYDTLVQQGKTQLQAGNNDAALASVNAAIKENAGRWEAYAVAGGALINLKRCDEAVTDLNEAIKLAPAEKQSGLQGLLQQCQNKPATAASSTSNNGPTLRETSDWLAKTLKAYGGTLYDDNGVRTYIEDAGITDGCSLYVIYQTASRDKRRFHGDTFKITLPVGAVNYLSDSNAGEGSILIGTLGSVIQNVGNSGSRVSNTAVIDVKWHSPLGGEQVTPGWLETKLIPRIIKAISHAADLCHGNYLPPPQSKEPF